MNTQETGTGSGNMNFFEIAAGIIGSLFAAGIAVGFLIVEVLSGGDRELPGRW